MQRLTTLNLLIKDVYNERRLGSNHLSVGSQRAVSPDRPGQPGHLPSAGHRGSSDLAVNRSGHSLAEPNVNLSAHPVPVIESLECLPDKLVGNDERLCHLPTLLPLARSA